MPHCRKRKRVPIAPKVATNLTKLELRVCPVSLANPQLVKHRPRVPNAQKESTKVKFRPRLRVLNAPLVMHKAWLRRHFAKRARLAKKVRWNNKPFAKRVA